MTVAAAPAFLRTPIERLVRALAPTRIVLFGSYAKGCQRPGSDVDLLVITNAAGEPGPVARRARQLVATSFPPIDLVLCTPEDAENAGEQRSPFLESILESGVTIYRSDESSASAEPPTRCGVRARR